MATFTSYLRNLNLFRDHSSSGAQTDAHTVERQVQSTRVYIAAVSLVLLIFGLSMWLSPTSTNSTIRHPRQAQFEALPLNAYCPCSRATPSYGDFVSLRPIFHEVCSSDFVSDRWTAAIFSGSKSTSFLPFDFRNQGSAVFRMLAKLCHLAQADVHRNIISFQTTSFINSEALPKSILLSKVHGAFEQFQRKIPNEFNSQLRLLRELTVGNQLVSALHTSMRLMYFQANESSPIATLIQYVTYGKTVSCDCYKDIDCSGIPLAIVDGSVQDLSNINSSLIRMIFPGLQAACTPVDSLLASSIECLYNQSCVNQIIEQFPTNESFTAMKVSTTSRFGINATVASIVGYLFIEEWMVNVSYENYFSGCAPLSCAYSKSERRSSIFVLTKLIGLLSSVTMVLALLIPVLVEWRVSRQTNEAVPGVSLIVRAKESLSQLKIKLIELNLFERQPNNERFVRAQQIATRVYVFVLIVSINLLSFYTLLSKEAHQMTVLKPTEAQYEQLREIHPDSLSCPCSNISIPYSDFVMLEANYHQLCSSDFVSWQWIDFNINADRFPFLYHLDYRRNAAFQFQLLATLCKWAGQTINSSLEVFLQTPFKFEMDQIIHEWQSGTTNRFIRTTQLIRAPNHGNMLINSVFNAEFQVEPTTRLLRVNSRNFDGCSCLATQTCRTEMGIYDYRLGSNTTTDLFTVRNFFFGCSPLESLLMSTLECFYQDELQSQPNEPIQYILQNLMVTSWSTNVSFSSFYRSCAPTSCTYEYYRSVSALFLVTTIIGITGGLSLILSILTLIIVRIHEETSDQGWIITVKTYTRSLWIVNQEHQIMKRFQFVLLYMMIFVVYAIATANLQPKIRQTPITSSSMYEALKSRYSSTLQCPCSQISVPYRSLLSVVPRFHELCNSTFMTKNPSAYILPSTDFPSSDFLATGTGQLALLQSLCQFSADTLQSALLQLLSSSTVNTRLLSRSAFNHQMQKVIDEFQSNVPNEILSSLALIQETTSSNMIMTVHLTNWKFAKKSPDRRQGLLHTVPIEYQQCNCGLSTQCVEPSRGMFAGCYPLVALFKSTLECFYNQSCIYLSTVFPSLDPRDLSTSRFPINTTIESMFSQLMVNAYAINLSYDKYFVECAPKSCSFSYRTQRSTLEIITLLISLYSGLTIVSACIVSHSFKLRSHRQQHMTRARINPQ